MMNRRLLMDRQGRRSLTHSHGPHPVTACPPMQSWEGRGSAEPTNLGSECQSLVRSYKFSTDKAANIVEANLSFFLLGKLRRRSKQLKKAW